MPNFFNEHANRNITIRHHHGESLSIPQHNGLFITTSYIGDKLETDILVTYDDKPHVQYGVLDSRINTFHRILNQHATLDSQTSHLVLPYTRAFALCSLIRAWDDETPSYLDALNALLPTPEPAAENIKDSDANIEPRPHKKRKTKNITFNLPDDTTHEALPLAHQGPDASTMKISGL